MHQLIWINRMIGYEIGIICFPDGRNERSLIIGRVVLDIFTITEDILNILSEAMLVHIMRRIILRILAEIICLDMMRIILLLMVYIRMVIVAMRMMIL